MKNKKNIIFVAKATGVVILGISIIVTAKLYRNSQQSNPEKNVKQQIVKVQKNIQKSDTKTLSSNTQNIKNKRQHVSKNVTVKPIGYGRLNGLFKPEGKSKYQKYHNQLMVLNSLKTPLLQDEVEDLHDFLRTGVDDRLTLHLKDEILIKLEESITADKSHINFLSEFSADKSIDGELRGYAVQHLRSEYSKADAKLRKKISETLFESLKDTQSDVSGTAMLALSDLSKIYPKEFDKEAINTELVALVEDSSMHVPSRIAMVQSVGSMKNDSESVANAVRDLAFNDPGDMTLRLTAIATIGEIGSKEDIKQLETLLKTGHHLYKIATNKAINKLKNNIK